MELNNLASKQYIDFKDLVSGTNLLASSLEKSFLWYQNEFCDSDVDIPQVVFNLLGEANAKLSEALEVLATLQQLTKQVPNLDEVIITIKELQKEINDGIGLSCVDTIVFFLTLENIREARNCVMNNWNEIRNYPEMANYLNEIFDLFEDP